MLNRRLTTFPLLLASLLVAGTALAAVTPTPVFPQTPNLGIGQLTNANSGSNAFITLYTAGANGSMCVGLFATNTDTAAYSLQVAVSIGASNYMGTTANIPLSSGNTSAAPPVNLMSAAIWPGLPINSDGNPYILLPSGDVLKVATTAQVTSAKFVTVFAVCSDF